MITMEELRRALDWPADKDQELADLRESLIGLWDETTGLLWNSRTDHVQQIRVFGAREHSVLLELIPVSSIALVEERFDGDPTWTELDSDYYELQGRRTLVRTDGSRFLANVRVTYDGGADSVEAVIRRALITQAKFEASRVQGADLTLVSKGDGKGGWKKLLSPDLHPSFARLAKRKGRKA